MAELDRPVVPIWAEPKAKKQRDIVQEVVTALEETERIRARQPIPEMTEADLEAEQLRLEELLHRGVITVENFRRLREIDFYLHEMRHRRQHGTFRTAWDPELSD